MSQISLLLGEVTDGGDKKLIEDLISWRNVQTAKLYTKPGRSFVVESDSTGVKYKIKGSGYYNPPGVSYSGLKRSVEKIEELDLPQPPLLRLFM